MKECTMEVKTLVRSRKGMRGHDLGFWVLKYFLICVVITQMITLGLSTLLCVCIYMYIYMHTHTHTYIYMSYVLFYMYYSSDNRKD